MNSRSEKSFQDKCSGDQPVSSKTLKPRYKVSYYQILHLLYRYPKKFHKHK